jgi:hypothetical protein
MADDRKLVEKPRLRKPPNVSAALTAELAAAAKVLRLAVEWRVACQNHHSMRVSRNVGSTSTNFSSASSSTSPASYSETKCDEDLNLASLPGMPEFRSYRQAVVYFLEAVIRTDEASQACRQQR